MDPRALALGQADDTERFAALTPEQRLALFVELCELTDSIVRHRPDADRLRAGTPRSAASEALWRSLMARSRTSSR